MNRPAQPLSQIRWLPTLIIVIMLIALYVIGQSDTSAVLRKFTTLLSNTAGVASQKSETVTLQDGDVFDLSASEVSHTIHGKSYSMLAYNGSIPGPTLKVKQGSTITIQFHNNSRYETLLHSHGLRLANASDGTPLTQKPIQPGESFTYTLTFADPGIYWYHPHIREDLQQDLGMYGAVVVAPKDVNYWEPVASEQIVFVDDLLIKDGDIPKSDATATHAMMGTYGNTMLVNGASDQVLSAAAGSVHRFYFINSANTRPFRLAIPGAMTKLVGSDGGAYEQETMTDAVTLGPSERAIIDVVFPKTGTYKLENQSPLGTTLLATIKVGPGQENRTQLQRFDELRSHELVRQSIDPYRSRLIDVPDKSIALSLTMMGMEGMGGMGHMMGVPTEDGIEWEDGMNMMNENSTPANIKWLITDQDTQKTNMDINWQFKTGDLVRIRITNSNGTLHPMQHPIHFHGNRFLISAIDDEPNQNLVWKDTAMIPAGKTVDLLLEISNPGKWMAHCHIAEHLESGMMLHYTVDGPSIVN